MCQLVRKSVVVLFKPDRSPFLSSNSCFPHKTCSLRNLYAYLLGSPIFALKPENVYQACQGFPTLQTPAPPQSTPSSPPQSTPRENQRPNRRAPDPLVRCNAFVVIGSAVLHPTAPRRPRRTVDGAVGRQTAVGWGRPGREHGGTIESITRFFIQSDRT